MQTTSVLFTTCLLAALASSQSTVTYVGEPEAVLPTFSLKPTQSSIISKYEDDIASYDDTAYTNSLDQSIGRYLATETAFPVESVISSALQGNQVPTSIATAVPTSLRDGFVSVYNGVASVAKSDLSADGSLSTIAPYYIAPAEASSRPKITQVVSGTKSARSSNGGVASTGFATTTSAASGSGVAAGSSGIVAASGSGPVGTGGSGSVALSTTASPPAATSPITSAKPSSGASERVSAGVGALLLVGAGFVALL